MGCDRGRPPRQLPQALNNDPRIIAIQGPGEQRLALGQRSKTKARLVMLLEPGGRILARSGPVGWISIAAKVGQAADQLS